MSEHFTTEGEVPTPSEIRRLVSTLTSLKRRIERRDGHAAKRDKEEEKRHLTRLIIEREWTVFSLYFGRRFGLKVLVNIWKFLTQRERAQMLRDAWEMIEQCYDEAWLNLWKTIDPADTMTAEERALLAAMPERVILFRGYCAKRGNSNGLSWTPDPEVAKWFARRTPHPTTRSIEIDRSEIWAFLLSRDGSEPECVVLYPPSERDSTK